MKRMERVSFPAGPGAVCFTPPLPAMPFPVVLRFLWCSGLMPDRESGRAVFLPPMPGPRRWRKSPGVAQALAPRGGADV